MPFPCASENAEAETLKNLDLPKERFTRELREEILKYLRFLPHVADPHLGRVEEIREELKKGGYLNREMIGETAARLALRFLRKE